jgi:hypothetical protein
MPLTVALHCSRVKKPQLVPPPALPPEYWAHLEYYRRASHIYGGGWLRKIKMAVGSLEIQRRNHARLSHALITVVRTLPNEPRVITNFAIASSFGAS